MGTVSAFQRHVRSYIKITVHHPQVDFGDVGHVVRCDLPPNLRGYIGVNGGKIIDWIGSGVGVAVFFALLIDPGVGTVPVLHKAVHKLPGFGTAQGQIFGSEIQRVKNSLDPVGIKAVSVLHHLLHRGNRPIQRGETGTHFGDIIPVLSRHGDGDTASIKGQFHRGIVMAGCSIEHGAHHNDDQDKRGQDSGDHHPDGFPGALVSEQHHRRFNEGWIGHRRSPPS